MEVETLRPLPAVSDVEVVVIKSRWLLPVVEDCQESDVLPAFNNRDLDGVISEYGAVAIHQHRIVAVGSVDRIYAAIDAMQYNSLGKPRLAVRIVDLSEKHLVMPGLINCHTHAAMNMFRGAVEDAPLDEWLQRSIWPLEKNFVNPETVFMASAAAAIESITHGTTTLNDMYYFPEAALEAFRQCGIRAVVGAPFIKLSPTATFVPPYDEACNFVKRVFSDRRKAKETTNNAGTCEFPLHRLTTASFVPHSIEAVDFQLFADSTKESECLASAQSGARMDPVTEVASEGKSAPYLVRATRRHLEDAPETDRLSQLVRGESPHRNTKPCSLVVKQPLIHMHLNEVKTHCERFLQEHGRSTLEFLRDKAQLSNRFVLAHCVHTTPTELEILRASGANVCHCPTSNMKLASGLCCVREMLDRGINVCLGTDGACSNNSLDMIAEMWHSILVAKMSSANAAALDPYTAIRMATKNGARALGMDDEIGSLEVGKLADIIAIDLSSTPDNLGYRVLDPLSHLLYTRHWKVTDSWIDGRRVLENGVVQVPRPNAKKYKELSTEIFEWSRKNIQKGTRGRNVCVAADFSAASPCK